MTASIDTVTIQKNAVRDFLVRVSRSRFFAISLLLHLLILILFGTKALFDAVKDEPDMIAAEKGEFVSTAPPAPPAPPAQPQQTKAEFKVKPVAPSAPAALSAITTLSNSSISMPAMLTAAPTRSAKFVPVDQPAQMSSPNTSNAQLSKETLASIAGFTGGWAQPGGGGSLKSRRFKFTAYIASYAGGDWASTVRLDPTTKTKVTGGSLPNLLYLMKKMSADKVEANPDPVPLDLSSDRIFVVKPPFIFFTGHRDFVLTDKEIENLRKYIRLGGAIWGDSSLPGSRSRFDLAFRREMKRVIPDLDKQFEPLPPDHDIFTKTYYPEIKDVPTGINYYQEPVYALKYNGEVAILYTANDYGDMWQIGLDTSWKIDTSKDQKGNYVALNKRIYDSRNLYFRGINDQSLEASFKFGTNVVIHLLTRWEDKVRGVRAL